jgi:hypothetical protein
VSNALAGTGIVVVALLRLHLLFGNTWMLLMMIVLGIVTSTVRLTACSIGIYLARKLIVYQSVEVLGFTVTSTYKTQMTVGCVYQILEAIFFSAASVLFLLAIGNAVGLRKNELLRAVFLKNEGVRLLLIMTLNLLCALLVGIAAVNDGKHTTLTHAALCIFPYLDMPGWIYGLALHTFLQSSYVTPRSLLTTAATNSSKMTDEHGSKTMESVYVDRPTRAPKLRIEIPTHTTTSASSPSSSFSLGPPSPFARKSSLRSNRSSMEHAGPPSALTPGISPQPMLSPHTFKRSPYALDNLHVDAYADSLALNRTAFTTHLEPVKFNE